MKRAAPLWQVDLLYGWSLEQQIDVPGEALVRRNRNRLLSRVYRYLCVYYAIVRPVTFNITAGTPDGNG